MDAKRVTMDQLPDDILLLIFKLVPQHHVMFVCARVCRRWAGLVGRRALLVQRCSDAEQLHVGVRSLHIEIGYHIFSDVLVAATSIATNLRHVTVHAGAPFTYEHLAALAHLPHLYHLDMFPRSRLLDQRVLPVLRRLGSFVANATIAPGPLSWLAAQEPFHLTGLHMYGHALHYPRSELLTLLRVATEHLTDLTLRCNEVDDRIYKAIGCCLKLKSLQLYFCWLMRHIGVEYVTRPPALRRLHITGARMVRSSLMKVFIEHLPTSIEELDLSATSFGDEHVEPLINRSGKLQVIELWRCPITREGVMKLAFGMQHLQVLDLDINLSIEDLKLLASHPSLRMVRCKPDIKDILSFTVVNELGNKIRVLSVNAQFNAKYLRGGGEGYRASLYYYWTRDLDPVSLPSSLSPTFPDENDIFY